MNTRLFPLALSPPFSSRHSGTSAFFLLFLFKQRTEKSKRNVQLERNTKIEPSLNLPRTHFSTDILYPSFYWFENLLHFSLKKKLSRIGFVIFCSGNSAPVPTASTNSCFRIMLPLLLLLASVGQEND